MQEKLSQISSQPYTWPHDGSLNSTTTALVVIDMQRDFCEEGGYLSQQGYDVTSTRAIIPSIAHLLSTFRHLSFPIFFTREGHRSDLSTLSSRERFRSRNNPSGLGIGDRGPLGRLLIRGEPGHEIISELAPIEGEVVIDKPSKGAFTSTDFEQILRIKGIKNLVFVGVTTDVCVHTTIREANDRGFDCLLVEDCCAASEKELHESAVKMMLTEGGIFGAVARSKQILDVLHG